MTILLQQIKDYQDEAKTFRKKGDSLRKLGREELALKTYEDGVNEARSAINELGNSQPSDSKEELEVALEFVETYGVLGGLLQRLGKLQESLDSYTEGALMEERYNLSSTYNRLNAIRLELLSGTSQLRNLTQKIRALAKFIENCLRNDSALSDKGWAWADLGDCRALLNDLKGAQEAYDVFIAKAEIKSPERTLDVLRQISEKLKQTADPDADHLNKAIQLLDERMHLL
jgi:hypothetical protein